MSNQDAGSRVPPRAPTVPHVPPAPYAPPAPPASQAPHARRAAAFRRLSGRGRAALTDLALLAGFYGLYTLVRNTVPSHETSATQRGAQVLHLETSLHLDPEHGLNSFITRHPLVANISDYYYAALHFVIVIAVLIWLYRRVPEAARRWAAAWYVMNLIAVLVFWLWPLAPPRLLPGAGFVDTVVRFHTWGSWGNASVASASNQYAAMPSLHTGWALWSGLAIFTFARRRWIRALGLLYPLATAAVVLSTANHYLFDVLGGVAACAAAFAILRGVRSVRTAQSPKRDEASASAGPPRSPSATASD